MKHFKALTLVSILGLALIPAVARAQEYGGVPDGAYRQAAPASSTPSPAFQALANSSSHAARQCTPGPDCDWTPSQLEGLLSVH